MHSFHNMYYVLQAKVDHFAVKIGSWKKAHQIMRQKMGHNAVYPDFGRRLTQNCWHKVNWYGAPSKIMMIMINIIYKSSCTQREKSAWVVISVIVGNMIPPAPIPSNSPGTASAKLKMGYFLVHCIKMIPPFWYLQAALFQNPLRHKEENET